MVLSLMRKHATSWIIKILIGLIAVVFVFYFGYSFRGGPNPKVASVNGEPISQRQYSATYQQLMEYYRKQYGDRWNESIIKALDIKGKALDILIKRELIRQKAKELGIQVTKEEIQTSIAKYPLFQTENKFDISKYKRFLDMMRYTPQDFEQEVQNQIIEQKLSTFFQAFLLNTDNEYKEMYNYFYEQVSFNYLLFEKSKYLDKVTISEDEVKRAFENNRDKYIIPEKIKITYVIFDPKNYEKDITVDDEQIKDYYEANMEKFKQPEQVKASHILLKVEDPKKEEEVKKKAHDIYKKLKEGKDFSKLASQYSQDPGSKDKGGDLGYFERGKMVKEFEEVAFTLNPGEISEPVKTQFGYHIIKVEDKKPEGTKTLEEAKEEIIKILKSQIASDKAYEGALKFLEGYVGTMDFKEYASSKGKKAVSPPPISRGEKPPVLGMEERQVEHLFSLEQDETSDIMTIQGRHYVFKIDEKELARQAELSEVKEKVTTDLKEEKAREKAKEEGEIALRFLKEGKSLEEISKELGVEIRSSGLVRRNQPVEQVGYVPEMMEEAFKLSKANPYPSRPIETPKGVVVLAFEDRKPPDTSKMEEEKKRLKLLLGRQEQEWIVANWLEAEKKKARIEIEKELL